MLYIIWSRENEIGIPIIDEQHRGIVSTINSLNYFIQKGQGLDALKPTFSILEQYTHIHFKTEEALIKEAGYEESKKHILLHNELIKRTREMALEAESFKEPELALVFLKKWWLNHINKEDKKYSTDVKQYLGI